jgi:electron transfer flavoprotein beta subunit
MSTQASSIIAAVLVKSVPIGGRFLRIEDERLTRSGVLHGLDPINEVPVEWAVRAREAGSIDRVVALMMGPPDASDAVRRAIALGCDEGIIVTDELLAGAGIRATAVALAAAVKSTGASLALFGNESLDGSSGAVPSATATLLDWPLISLARTASLEAGVFRAERDLGMGPEIAEASLPVVASFVAGGVEPRYPKIKELSAARKVELKKFTAADLEILSSISSGETVLRLEKIDEGISRRTSVVGLEEGVDEITRLLISAGSIDG